MPSLVGQEISEPLQFERPMLSIIIPAYNEEKTIEHILKRTRCAAENLGFRHEIIVIDDGSVDSTPMLVSKNDVRLLRFSKNKGKGVALRTGLQVANGEVVVFMDSDCSHQPEEIGSLITPILKGESDAVLGSRFLGKREMGSIAPLNAFGNIVFNWIIFLLAGQYFTDTQSGFRALKSSIAKSLNMDSQKYEVESEMLIELVRMRCKIKEVGITCKKSTRPSHLSPLSDSLRIFRIILLKSLSTKKAAFQNGS